MCERDTMMRMRTMLPWICVMNKSMLGDSRERRDACTLRMQEEERDNWYDGWVELRYP